MVVDYTLIFTEPRKVGPNGEIALVQDSVTFIATDDDGAYQYADNYIFDFPPVVYKGVQYFRTEIKLVNTRILPPRKEVAAP